MIYIFRTSYIACACACCACGVCVIFCNRYTHNACVRKYILHIYTPQYAHALCTPTSIYIERRIGWCISDSVTERFPLGPFCYCARTRTT